MASDKPPLALRSMAVGLTDRGMQREHNEDSFLVLEDFGLYIVADGMGGHRAGDVASKLATESIADFFRTTANNEDVTWPFHFDTNLTEEENRLLTGIRVANRQIMDRSERSRDCQGMGTTVVGALFSARKNRLFIGHVGDSRCYRIRDGKISQLTRDHSLLNEYKQAIPDLTEEQMNELPRNVITRALGMHRDVQVDLRADEPIKGDVYLLCSDGLSGMIADEEILELIGDGRDLGKSVRRLIDRANENGGDDNITGVLIRFDSPSTIDDEDTISTAPTATRVRAAQIEDPPPSHR